MTDQPTRPIIMLADDDIEIRRILMRALGSLDAELIEASDGEQALEAIIQHQPDLDHLRCHDANPVGMGTV